MVDEHIQKKEIEEEWLVPAHGKRDTKAFHETVEQLKRDGNYYCKFTGATENLEVHHLQEFSLENITDFDKLKKNLMWLDPYGYSAKMKDIPITHIDDIRNMLVLSEKWHRGKGIGIHYATFDLVFGQANCKEGESVFILEDLK